MSSVTADTWDARHSLYKSKFSNTESSFPVSAEITYGLSHAQWKVSWVKSSSNVVCKTVSQEKDILSKLASLNKAVISSIDLTVVLMLYGMLSNRAVSQGKVGDVPTFEYAQAWKTVNHVTDKTNFNDRLGEWLNRILNHEWMDDEIVHSEYTAKKKIRTNQINPALRQFLLDMKIALGNLSPCFSWIEGKIWTRSNTHPGN